MRIKHKTIKLLESTNKKGSAFDGALYCRDKDGEEIRSGDEITFHQKDSYMEYNGIILKNGNEWKIKHYNNFLDKWREFGIKQPN